MFLYLGEEVIPTLDQTTLVLVVHQFQGVHFPNLADLVCIRESSLHNKNGFLMQNMIHKKQLESTISNIILSRVYFMYSYIYLTMFINNISYI